MHKSNKYTSLTQPYGRKQRLLPKSPLVLNHIPCYTTFKTAFWDRLEVKSNKRPCNHPLNYFRQLVLVKFRTQKITEMPYFDALARHLSRYLFFILPKYPLPAPTCRPFLKNHSIFWISVESTWKHIKFATFYVCTGKNKILRSDLPLSP